MIILIEIYGEFGYIKYKKGGKYGDNRKEKIKISRKY